jgi:hypothetical protein
MESEDPFEDHDGWGRDDAVVGHGQHLKEHQKRRGRSIVNLSSKIMPSAVRQVQAFSII